MAGKLSYEELSQKLADLQNEIAARKNAEAALEQELKNFRQLYDSMVADYRKSEALLHQRTAELAESEEKFRTLVENVPLVVYRIGGGEIVFVNHFVEELVGYSRLELLDTPGLWRNSIYSGDRERVVELRRNAIQEGRELVLEYRIVHKDKHLVYVVDHAIPVRRPDGRIQSLDGIIFDVTGRVKLQEQLIRNEGDRTIREVSARLAHEIRNPLVSAGGFARRLLSSMDANDPQRQKVEIIIKEVGRLEGILRMVLNYIQPFDLEISPADLNSLLNVALLETEADCRKKELSVRAELSPLPFGLLADQFRLKEALKSLLKNAFSQMPPGESMEISTSLEGGSFRVSVSYPVLHLSADDVEHFFYPFVSSNPDYPADLPMAKIIIDKHGGAIEVELERTGLLLIRLSLPVQPVPHPGSVKDRS